MRNKETWIALNLFFALICAVVVASCLTPLVLRAIDTFAFLEGLRKYSGAKVFRRLMIIFFLLGVWAQRHQVMLLSAEEIGFARHQAWRRHVLTGLLVGLIGLLGLEVVALGVGYRVPDNDFGRALLLEAVVRGLATAVAVGILEEIVFRGALFHALLQRTNRVAAIGLTSSLFAALHFFRAGSSHISRASLWVGPLSAWDLLRGWWDHFHLFPDFLGLLMVSVVLCWSVLLSRDIFVAIGLHIGWVFVIQSGKQLFDKAEGISSILLGGWQFYDGLVTIALMVAMLPFLQLCVRWGWITPVEPASE